MYENKNEACSEEYRINDIGPDNDLSKEECMKICDSREECKYAFLNNENWCGLYSLCLDRRLMLDLGQLGSVFEKGYYTTFYVIIIMKCI